MPCVPLLPLITDRSSLMAVSRRPPSANQPETFPCIIFYSSLVRTRMMQTGPCLLFFACNDASKPCSGITEEWRLRAYSIFYHPGYMFQPCQPRYHDCSNSTRSAILHAFEPLKENRGTSPARSITRWDSLHWVRANTDRLAGQKK